MNNRKTVFLDIDGTIFYHRITLHKMITEKPEVLDGVIDKLTEWRTKDYYIVITTARPKGTKTITEKQLYEAGIFYDDIVMGLPTGFRVVINDKKLDGLQTTQDICLTRNVGIGHIKI